MNNNDASSIQSMRSFLPALAWSCSVLFSATTLANDVFTVTSGPINTSAIDPNPVNVTASGDVDFNKDGISDGTWSLSIDGSSTAVTASEVWVASSEIIPGDYIGALVSIGVRETPTGNNSRPWDMDAKFTIDANVPGVTFKPTARGSLTYPSDTGGAFQNNFLSYGFTWSDGAGGTSATILDPRSQLVIPSSTNNGFAFSQGGASGTTLTYISEANGNTQSCNSGGSWANACVAWQVGTPAGFKTLNMTATEGRLYEGFGFGIISQTDVATTKTAAVTEILEEASSSFTVTIVNQGVVGDSAATGLSWSDVLPSAFVLTGATFNITRNNTTFNSTSDMDFAGLLDVDLVNNTVSFDQTTLQIGDVIEITINYTAASGAGGNAVTNTAGILGMAQSDTDLSNDTSSATVTIITPAAPAFPPGTGLVNSICNAAPATNAYQDIGLRWEHNNNGGMSPDATISNTNIFDSATVASYVGIDAQINNYSVNVDADTIPPSYDPNYYIEYQFTTAAFTNLAELRGFGATVFGKKDPTHTIETGRYRFAIAIDNDAAFTSPEILISEAKINDVDTSDATVAEPVTDNGQYLRTFAHWDPNGNTISLDPSTTYTVRIYPYEVIDFGDKSTADYPNIVLWDDFMLKAVSCDEDYGDAPTDLSFLDASMSSTYGDASHLIDSAVHLGALIDIDMASQNAGFLADGDDNDGSNDDDGVTFPLAGSTRVLRVDQANDVIVQASTNGFLNAWIDWNQDGDWDDAGEAIATNTPLTAGANTLSLTPTMKVPQGATYMRFRFTSESVTLPSPLGQMDDGEVEDYRVNLILAKPIDVCSSVIQNTGFESGPFPANYTFVAEDQISGWATAPQDPASGPSFSARNQIEIWRSGFQGVTALEGDYFAELNAQVPGMLYQDVELTPGSSYTWSFAHRGRAGVDTINVLMGSPDSPTIQGTYSTGTAAWKFYGGIYTVPLGQDITRFGFQADGSSVISGSGNFIDALKIPGGCDFGDAPAGYNTLLSNNAAHHVTNNLLYLGANPGDSETDGQPSAAADSDDAVAVADEDGVTSFETLRDSDRNYSVDVVTTNQTNDPAKVVAWIDFDGNGSFDSDESAQRTVPTGTSSAITTLTWAAIPPDIQKGDSYIRIRITTEAISHFEPGGIKENGEVEDYAITINGTAISGKVYIDINSDGIADASELGIGNTVVVLYDVFTGICQSVSTTGDGDYRFSGVLNGAYEVYQAHGETTPVPQNCGTAFAKNPAGYQSTTPDTLTINVSDADVPNQDFGEVRGSTETGLPGNALSPDNQGVVTPGGLVNYAHVFTTTADGTVTFDTTGSLNITNGWGARLYEDSNCDGILNGNEAGSVINGTSIDVTGGSQVCLINRVFAPSNALPQEQYQSDITALFDYDGGTLPSSTLTASDLTVVTPNDGGTLVLEKSVANLTQGGAYTMAANQAKHGDELRYRVIYSNPGTGPVTDVTINDEVPAFTSYQSGSAVCDSTPATMVCTPSVNGSAVEWVITGQLPAGASGEVSFKILIDN